ERICGGVARRSWGEPSGSGGRRSESRAPATRQQNPPRTRSPTAAHHRELLETEVGQQLDEHRARVEAQVVGERVEVGFERTGAERQAEPREKSVIGRGEQDETSRAQDATHLR